MSQPTDLLDGHAVPDPGDPRREAFIAILRALKRKNPGTKFHSFVERYGNRVAGISWMTKGRRFVIRLPPISGFWGERRSISLSWCHRNVRLPNGWRGDGPSEETEIDLGLADCGKRLREVVRGWGFKL
jgi:hypothetical protein